MAEGSSVAGSLHAANDNPEGDDGGSNEAGNSEVVSLMDRLRAPTKSDLTRKRSLAQKIWGESEHNGHKASIMGGVTGHNRGILKESEHSIIGKNLSILCTGLTTMHYQAIMHYRSIPCTTTATMCYHSLLC